MMFIPQEPVECGEISLNKNLKLTLLLTVIYMFVRLISTCNKREDRQIKREDRQTEKESMKHTC